MQSTDPKDLPSADPKDLPSADPKDLPSDLPTIPYPIFRRMVARRCRELAINPADAGPEIGHQVRLELLGAWTAATTPLAAGTPSSASWQAALARLIDADDAPRPIGRKRSKAPKTSPDKLAKERARHRRRIAEQQARFGRWCRDWLRRFLARERERERVIEAERKQIRRERGQRERARQAAAWTPPPPPPPDPTKELAQALHRRVHVAVRTRATIAREAGVDVEALDAALARLPVAPAEAERLAAWAGG
jgi:hypothetical protein